MMVSRLISDDGLTLTKQGFDIDIRLPWYRSLPVSSVAILDVLIDGKKIDPASIAFGVNGKRFRLDELESQIDNVWFVLDSGLLHITHPALQHGAEHQVDVTVRLRPPYIKGFTPMTRCEKRLRAH